MLNKLLFSLCLMFGLQSTALAGFWKPEPDPLDAVHVRYYTSGCVVAESDVGLLVAIRPPESFAEDGSPVWKNGVPEVHCTPYGLVDWQWVQMYKFDGVSEEQADWFVYEATQVPVIDANEHRWLWMMAVGGTLDEATTWACLAKKGFTEANPLGHFTLLGKGLLVYYNYTQSKKTVRVRSFYFPQQANTLQWGFAAANNIITCGL